MKTLHTETWVAAGAPMVWSVVTDFARWPDWNPVMRLEGELKVGAPLLVTLKPGTSSPVIVNATIVRLEEGFELRWRGGLWLRGLCDGEHGLRVVPEDTGRSRLEQFEVFRGLLARPLIGGRMAEIETGFQVMNRFAKREAERRAREQS